MEHRETGLTLIETVLTIAITGIIVGALFAFQRGFFETNSSFQQSLLSQQQAQNAIQQMLSEIRAATPADNGAYPIESVSETSFIFYSNADNDDDHERIRYFVENGTLKKGTTQPVGTPAVYDLDTEVVRSIVNHIDTATTTPMFTYYNESFAGTSSPLTIPVSAIEVRFIEIMLLIDFNPGLSPDAMQVTGRVAIRNLKND
jgi:type II secretory pathway component PulJ